MAKEKPANSAKPAPASTVPFQNSAPSKGGAGTDPTGKCTAQGCKTNSSRFDFCAEHYEQFKFGLITKLGKQVSDYEKKFDHYQAYLSRTQVGRKAA